MNPTLRHTTIFLALLTLLLTACGRSAPTHFYLLDSGQPPLTADSLPAASLSIAPVSVPDYLDRNGLVRRSDGQTRLEVSELDIWAEPLGQGARRVLGEVLAARLLPRGIDVITGGDRQGDMELYAGDCPLEDTGAVLDAEQHYTVCHYMRCRGCGALYFVGACIRGAPVFRQVADIRKENLDTRLWGRCGTYYLQKKG